MIEVRCSTCKASFDEAKVEITNIEENISGQDVVTFTCPLCNTARKSLRRGSA
jgi:Zn finger protein HypA/HybF involved in hydrogenase expression